MSESFGRTFTRTALGAKFKTGDNVPILRTPIVHILGSTVGEIDEMSHVFRFFEYLWLTFAGLLTGSVVLIGLILLSRPDRLGEVSLWALIAFALIWLFSVIQFLSLFGYLRYRLARK